MNGEILLPIGIQDNASQVLQDIARNAQRTADTLESLATAFEDAFSGGNGDGTNKTIENAEKQLSAFAEASQKWGDVVKRNFKGIFTSLYDLENEAISLRGRLILALDPGTSVNQAFERIEEEANKARVPVNVLAEAFANLGATSGQYFSNDELASFVGSLSGYASIVGATTTQIESAQYQLTQAFSKGRLAMDDFRPLMNSLPGIANDLAEQLGVSVQELQRMVSAGEVTSDKIKEAFIGMSDVVQERLALMPKTFQQSLVGVNNSVFRLRHNIGLFVNEIKETQLMQDIMASLEVVVDRLNDAFIRVGRALVIAFGGEATQGVAETEERVNAMANGILIALGLIATGLAILTIRWLVMGITAFVSSFLALWPLYMIIAVFILIITALNAVGISFADIFGFIGGIIGVFIAFVYNLFGAWLEWMVGLVNFLGRIFSGFANFFSNLFNDPIASIIYLFRDMANAVLGIINSIAKALDWVFGSNLSGTVSGWMDGVDELADKAANTFGNGSYDANEWEEIKTDELGAARADYGESFNSGFTIGSGIGGVLDNLGGDLGGFGDGFFNDALGAGREMGGIGNQLSDYDSATGKGSLSTSLDKKSVDELKAFAEIQYRLNYQQVSPEFNVSFGDVNTGQSLDDISKYVEKIMNEDLAKYYITEVSGG